MKRTGFYYEFYKNGNYVSTGFSTLSSNTLTTGIDTIPSMELTIPLSDLPEENMALYDVIVYMQKDGRTKYVFHGVIDKMVKDFANYSVQLSLSHYVARMRDWIMPAGYTVKKFMVSTVVGEQGAALGSPNTLGDPTAYAAMPIKFVVQDDAEVSLSFSSSNKLEALSEVLKYTEDLHFRVELNAQDTITIGRFGVEKNVMISPNPVPEDDCESDFISTADDNFVTMLTEPTYNVEYTGHFNRAVVFCGDVAHDVAHLTLQPLYDLAEYRNHGEFPVGMYDQNINQQPETAWEQKQGSDGWTKINNEKIYENNEPIVYSNNDNREFYVTDQKQLNEDGGIVRCATYQFADMHPIPQLEDTDDEGNKIIYTITDDDRMEMCKLAWRRAVRILKSQRPEHVYQFNCTALPSFVDDGDKVRFVYVKKILVPKTEDEDCEDFDEVVASNVDESIYMTKRTITFDSTMNETTTITLDRELKYRDFSEDEWELTNLAAEEGNGTGELTYGSGVRGNPGRTSTNTDGIDPDSYRH